MKRIRTLLLVLICWSVLIGTSVAQESVDAQSKAKAEAQEKAKIQRAIRRERSAAARAVAEQSRAANRALQVQRRAAAKAAAQTTQAVMRAYRQQQRAVELNRIRPRVKQIQFEEKQRLENTFKFLWSRPTVDIKNVVTGAPYSAKAVTEHTQTLSDGNQIIHRNEALYYRDNEGRLRIEQTLKTIGKWTVQDEPEKLITIYDPVAGNYYSLNPQERCALKYPSGTLRMREYRKIEDSPKEKMSPEEELDSRRKTETLGKQTIEGVVAEGTRTTRTIPAREIGNVRPIEIIDERWYSPELQLHVLTKHQDPRSGETVYRLTDIHRGEQDRSLFEVPSDYRIEDKLSYRSPKKVEQKKAP